ncbi:MAG: riboflavin synthase [Desulfobacca sp.]|uniref:riboflavin synthase n=1 Tax=Desulfobacca sp. TaxID=2067990 RepID=UPI00404ABAE6
MFTGLVEGIGRITARQPLADGLRLSATAPFDLATVQLGDSIAVSGPCLTVVAVSGQSFTVEVSPETLQRTNLGEKAVGARVNLERALRLGDRLGGHIVSGHIDCVGEVVHRRAGPRHLQLTVRLPGSWSRYVIEKGSIALDGVSLTVNTVQGNEFSVNIIPHTARQTTLEDLRLGDRLNVETDIIGKYVEKLLHAPRQPTAESLTTELLARHGFI